MEKENLSQVQWKYGLCVDSSDKTDSRCRKIYHRSNGNIGFLRDSVIKLLGNIGGFITGVMEI